MGDSCLQNVHCGIERPNYYGFGSFCMHTHVNSAVFYSEYIILLHFRLTIHTCMLNSCIQVYADREEKLDSTLQQQQQRQGSDVMLVAN